VKISKDGIRLIIAHEGFRPTPYICAGGKLTIGYGHVILPDEILTLKSVTHEQAQKLLERDVEAAEGAVNREVGPTHQAIFDALISFSYNVGITAFKNSTLLRKVKAGQYRLAALEFTKWVNAGGSPLKGLIARRAEEAVMFTVGAVKCGYII